MKVVFLKYLIYLKKKKEKIQLKSEKDIDFFTNESDSDNDNLNNASETYIFDEDKKYLELIRDKNIFFHISTYISKKNGFEKLKDYSDTYPFLAQRKKLLWIRW